MRFGCIDFINFISFLLKKKKEARCERCIKDTSLKINNCLYTGIKCDYQNQKHIRITEVT